MKNMFPQYDVHSADDFAEIWREGVFIFDTNVLLSIYRYRESTRTELLNVLKKLRAQIWIPYHVALEFQRNRLSVIAEQNSKFAEVKSVVEKARTGLTRELEKLQLKKKHSLIHPDALIDGFNKLAEKFLEDLEELKNSQRSLTKFDALRDEIEDLFVDRVGPPPIDQGEIDRVQKDAETRYKFKIPPGFLDADKDKGGSDEFPHGGMIYKRKFGDYVIWDQIIKKAKSEGLKAVLFVTDDVKEDWWHRLDSEGPKTLGPRPELVEELMLRGGVKAFLMYTTENFLKHAGELLQAEVSADTLSEIRDVSLVAHTGQRTKKSTRGWNEGAYHAIHAWLEATPNFNMVRGQDPDFRGSFHEESYAFDVVIVEERSEIDKCIRGIDFHARLSCSKDYDHYIVVFAVDTVEDGDLLMKKLVEFDLVFGTLKFRAVVGTLIGMKFEMVAEGLFGLRSS